ncbi:hypothetical protein PILCRDRAFT_732939 [Piloderma croceum F 1598]|uniref:Uncharacterized protein n=1 Tax=Piloderma croceum (strain F 1598) TaxID=765440 RepID=A0A0C3B730_PILCF|nr:hypothetical protein PILCRDRAFT_732939 [Piloderma croceum F 1598]
MELADTTGFFTDFPPDSSGTVIIFNTSFLLLHWYPFHSLIILDQLYFHQQRTSQSRLRAKDNNLEGSILSENTTYVSSSPHVSSANKTCSSLHAHSIVITMFETSSANNQYAS